MLVLQGKNPPESQEELFNHIIFQILNHSLTLRRRKSGCSIASHIYVCVFVNVYSSPLFNPFNSTNFAKHSSASISSNASNTLPFPAPPGCSTLGSTDHSLIVSGERPPAMRARPKVSLAMSIPSQLDFSARPSKGDALACTPLSPLLGTDFSPSSL